MKSAAFALLSLLAFCSLGFALWTQNVLVLGFDQNGNPAEGAKVEITYQNASALSESDGFLSGELDENGSFAAKLSNKVPADFEVRKFKARLYTGYWAGETRAETANQSGTIAIRFTVPVELQKITVRAISRENESLSGATVALTGAGQATKKSTRSDGSAYFWLPKGAAFTGYVSYANQSAEFSPAQAVGDGTGLLVTVALKPAGASSAGAGGRRLRIVLFSEDGAPLDAQQVTFYFAGKSYVAYTDPAGAAALDVNGSGEVQVLFQRHEYAYKYSFNDSVNATHDILLEKLLKINSFFTVQLRENCYQLVANITDPRTSLPIDVSMSKYGPTLNATLDTRANEVGLFISELCIKSDTQVKVEAKNKYDRAEHVQVISFAAPKPAEPAGNASTSLVPNEGQKQEVAGGEVFLSALVVLVIVGAALAFVFGRRYMAQVVRFVVEYLRHTAQQMEKKRQPPKPKMPPLEPPEGIA